MRRRSRRTTQGKPELPGGMLYTRYGKGAYIFTAYSWFRELPAGVPGAYRIFANLISAGKAVEIVARALITGASSGIGVVFARKLAARGLRPDPRRAARRPPARAGRGLSTRVEVLTADLHPEKASARWNRRSAIAKVSICSSTTPASERWAGSGRPIRSAQISMHEVHVMATMRLTHAALDRMVPRAAAASSTFPPLPASDRPRAT